MCQQKFLGIKKRRIKEMKIKREKNTINHENEMYSSNKNAYHLVVHIRTHFFWVSGMTPILIGYHGYGYRVYKSISIRIN